MLPHKHKEKSTKIIISRQKSVVHENNARKITGEYVPTVHTVLYHGSNKMFMTSKSVDRNDATIIIIHHYIRKIFSSDGIL